MLMTWQDKRGHFRLQTFWCGLDTPDLWPPGDKIEITTLMNVSQPWASVLENQPSIQFVRKTVKSWIKVFSDLLSLELKQLMLPFLLVEPIRWSWKERLLIISLSNQSPMQFSRFSQCRCAAVAHDALCVCGEEDAKADFSVHWAWSISFDAGDVFQFKEVECEIMAVVCVSKVPTVGSGSDNNLRLCNFVILTHLCCFV